MTGSRRRRPASYSRPRSDLTSTFPGVSHASLKAAGGRLWPEGTPRVPWADDRFKTATPRFLFPAAFRSHVDVPGRVARVAESGRRPALARRHAPRALGR